MDIVEVWCKVCGAKLMAIDELEMRRLVMERGNGLIKGFVCYGCMDRMRRPQDMISDKMTRGLIDILSSGLIDILKKSKELVDEDKNPVI